MKKFITYLGCVLSGLYLAVPFIPFYEHTCLVKAGEENGHWIMEEHATFMSPMREMVDLIPNHPIALLFWAIYFGLIGLTVTFFIIDRNTNKKKKWIFLGVATLLSILLILGLCKLPRG